MEYNDLVNVLEMTVPFARESRPLGRGIVANSCSSTKIYTNKSPATDKDIDNDIDNRQTDGGCAGKDNCLDDDGGVHEKRLQSGCG